MGRHTTFTQELADEICERSAEGEPLREICRDDHMPAWRTVYCWREQFPEFDTAIARARNIGEEALLEDTLPIADDGRNDWIERENKRTGKTFVALNDEAIARSKLRIETRLKLLAKWNPKRWGERISQEISNPDGSLQGMNSEQMAAKLESIAQAAAKRKEVADEADDTDVA